MWVLFGFGEEGCFYVEAYNCSSGYSAHRAFHKVSNICSKSVLDFCGIAKKDRDNTSLFQGDAKLE